MGDKRKLDQRTADLSLVESAQAKKMQPLAKLYLPFKLHQERAALVTWEDRSRHGDIRA
jgi:hypothetical protein